MIINIADIVVGLSTQSIWNINNPPKFLKLILKNCNKLNKLNIAYFSQFIFKIMFVT